MATRTGGLIAYELQHACIGQVTMCERMNRVRVVKRQPTHSRWPHVVLFISIITVVVTDIVYWTKRWHQNVHALWACGSVEC